MAAAYSFLNATAAYSDAFGNLIDLSAGQGFADEGIVVEYDEDKVSITKGADGEWMYSLHAASAGMVTLNLLKTPFLNKRLSDLYTFTTSSSAYTGQGVITGGDPQRGDSFTAIGCQIRKFPNNVFAKEGGNNAWVFLTGRLTIRLGSGRPALGINGGL